MKDANYSVATGIAKGALGGDDNFQGAARLAPITSNSSQRFKIVNSGATAGVDCNYVTVQIFGS